ncbi:ribonuclease Oy-like [Ostrea edulis]|uniref:ribonuclease Oy-like n=1 Tax=Ostrea edulis TaxID=37623 RepID=UPI0024AFB021|nr:ribonuclease Oy-like [Ostrea edulis]XP_048738068.2 ribonuclease Oy-like [Ostrea edulis]
MEYIYGIFIIAAFPVVFTDAVESWSYFSFAQQWPIAVCAQHTPCKIPQSVQGWGIHGLWPSADSKSRGPENCNSSWPFDINDVKPLVSDLKRDWPNLFPDTKENSFWKHEWSKHGTCAISLPATSNQLKYFSMGLQLYNKYNLTKILLNQGIITSNTAGYMVNATEAALKRELGVNTVVQCVYDKEKTKKQLLYEIEICVNKKFQLIDCYNDKTPQSTCPKHEPVFYPPLHDEELKVELSVI